MHSREKANYTSKVSHSDKKYHNKIYFNKKSFTAMFLSAALLLTSIDSMQVQAEELAGQPLPGLTGEETEMEDTLSGNTLPEGEGTAEPDYVKTESGAVIINSFMPLSEEESQLVLDGTGERLPLEEVVKRLPAVLKANVRVYDPAEPGTGGEEQPGEGETQPGSGTGEEQQPAEGEQPGSGTGEEQQPAEGEQPGSGTGEGQQPAEGEQPGNNTGEEQQPAEGEQPGSGTGEEQQPAEGEQPGSGTGEGQQPAEGEQPGSGTGEEQQPAEGEQPGSGTGEEQQPAEGEQPGSGTGEEQQPAEGEQPGADTGNDPSAAGQEQSGTEERQSETEIEEPDANDVAVAGPNKDCLPESGCQWRLLAAAEAGTDGADESAGGEGKTEESGSDAAESSDNAGGSENNDGTDSDGNVGDAANSGADENDSTGENGSAVINVDNIAADETDDRANAEGNVGSGESGSVDNAGGKSDSGGEDEDKNTDGGEDTGGTGNSGSVSDNTSNSETDGNDSETELPGEDSDNLKATSKLVAEVPVTWNCAGYENTYQNTEITEFVFQPEWKIADWSYMPEQGENFVPSVTVRYTKVMTNQDELAAAIAAGQKDITLKEDIFLTAPLQIPAGAQITLDGQGHSLRRWSDESGTFHGIMIRLDGTDYTEENFGRLTLRNITVDGKTEDNHANAPAIWNKGSLTLETKAVVRDNYNYGTYPKAEGDGTEIIQWWGGGIRVCGGGELTVKENSQVTGNYADNLGGGVYLETGATIRLYQDAVKENSVAAENGYGADVYACAGSTVYYNPYVDLAREGFYLCKGVSLIPMKDSKDPIEVFVGVNRNSGYSDEQVEEFKQALRKKGYTVLSAGRTDINTTDLRDWYVYDHYEPALWGGVNGSTAVPAEWTAAYGGDPKRKYYPFSDSNNNHYVNYYYDAPDGTKKLVTTIERWLECIKSFPPGSELCLTRFKEHIYSGIDEDGMPMMTFGGYPTNPYTDFLFYDPESDGEKVVDFDVDSSKVFTHTLVGNGFLLNTGVDNKGTADITDDTLSGYLVFYTYTGSGSTAKADSVGLYRLENVLIEELHHYANSKSLGLGVNYARICQLYPEYPEYQQYLLQTMPTGCTMVAEITSDMQEIKPEEWETEMSIQIRVTPSKIEVRQQPKSVEADISQGDNVVWSYDIPEKSGYSGFGPLVAYQNHSCSEASAFTYSNLRMAYVNPELEAEDMLSPLEKADYTQEGVQRIFINLFGNSSVDYNESASFGQYQEYMKIMQQEGIALVTDRKTPFAPYLGVANDPDSNLFELDFENRVLPSPEELADRVYESLSGKISTEYDEKLGLGLLTPASPVQSVGNTWLKSAQSGEQVRKLYGKSLGENGYTIQIMDDIARYYGDESDITVEYEILKPDRYGYIPLGDAVSPGNPTAFTVTADPKEWPSGRYTVRQKVKNSSSRGYSSIKGYSYFEIEQDDEAPPVVTPPDPPTPPDPEEFPDPPEVKPDPPVVEPDPPVVEPDPPVVEPDPPVVEPDPPVVEPDPPVVEPDPPVVEPDPPKPTPPKKSSRPSEEHSDPPVEYMEETIEVSAGEPVSVAAPVAAPVVQPEEPEEDPHEPRTGDMPIPALPASLGAGTAFMVKIRLWLYELETGISEEKKNEILRSLVGWAKGRAMIRVYLAIAATAVVLTAYHLLRALDARRRQVVEWFGR